MKKLLLALIWITFIIRIMPSLPTYQIPFDSEYWYSRLNTSQWRDPVSKNPVSDAELYKIAGYDLVTTHEFFKINPEVPPLGKYLYGWSILLFNNAEVASFIMFMCIVILFYYLAGLILKNILYQTIATILIIMDPLFFEHSRVTLLDFPQLIALLIHIIAFYYILHKDAKQKSDKKEYIYSLIAGVSFGAFISTKFAFLGAIILIADLIILMLAKKYKHIVVIGISSLFIYLLSYIMYFIQGHSIREFLGAQKWILHFYLSSNVQPVYGTVFTTLLIGLSKGWHDGATWEGVKEWTILWSFYLLGTLYAGIRIVIKRMKITKIIFYILILTAGLTLAYIYLPFFTRYLILTLPLMILLTLKAIQIHIPFHTFNTSK